MKPTIYGERFAYKYKDNIITRPTLNFHDIYLIQYALEQANINIPAIKKAYEENWKLLSLIIEEYDTRKELLKDNQQKQKVLKNIKEKIKKELKNEHNN